MSVQPDISKAQQRHYEPDPDSTLEAFHADDSQVRGVCGPVGSGKSSSMIAELVMRAQRQEPDMLGMRRTAWVVCRASYPSLVTTTLKIWNFWMPTHKYAKMNMSPPMRWHWLQQGCFPDGTGIDMEVTFLSVSDPRADISKLKSLNITGIWVNEAQEILDRILIEGMIERCGRYPDPQIAPLTWSGLIMDANAMDVDHWWYDWAEKETPKGYKFWHQPPALLKNDKGEWVINPKCENIKGQPKREQYWIDLVAGKHESWIRLNLCAEYGQTQAGKPVYPEYDDARHCAKVELKPIEGMPLTLAFDYALNPTCVINQISPAGQFRVLDEVCNPATMGMRRFLSDHLKPFLAYRYPGYPIQCVGEPSGNRRADTDESTANDEIANAGLGQVTPATTNLFKARRDAVASFMMKRVHSMVTGEQSAEGFLVSPTCKRVLAGLRGKYVLQRVRIEGHDAYKDEAVKNEYAHAQDCIQSAAVLYDRPRVLTGGMDRRWQGADGKKFEIGVVADYPWT